MAQQDGPCEAQCFDFSQEGTSLGVVGPIFTDQDARTVYNYSRAQYNGAVPSVYGGGMIFFHQDARFCRLNLVMVTRAIGAGSYTQNFTIQGVFTYPRIFDGEVGGRSDTFAYNADSGLTEVSWTFRRGTTDGMAHPYDDVDDCVDINRIGLTEAITGGVDDWRFVDGPDVPEEVDDGVVYMRLDIGKTVTICPCGVTRPPTPIPTPEPSTPPTVAPTAMPTLNPTDSPSRNPTDLPTVTGFPSDIPTATPSGTSTCTEVIIDFEEFEAGDVPLDLGHGIKVRGNNKAGSGVMIFDTANPTGQDEDLASTDLGKILILSENGISTDPDDNALGGFIRFTFDPPVSEVVSVDLKDFDSDGSSITGKYDDGSKFPEIAIEAGEDGSEQTVMIEQVNVGRLRINLAGSGGIDNLVVVFCSAE